MTKPLAVFISIKLGFLWVMLYLISQHRLQCIFQASVLLSIKKCWPFLALFWKILAILSRVYSLSGVILRWCIKIDKYEICPTSVLMHMLYSWLIKRSPLPNPQFATLPVRPVKYWTQSVGALNADFFYKVQRTKCTSNTLYGWNRYQLALTCTRHRRGSVAAGRCTSWLRRGRRG